MASPKDLVAVGQVIKPHGVKGECCVQSYADSLVLFDSLRSVRLAAPGADPAHGRTARIKACRPHQGRLLVTFEGVADRDAADALRGLELAVPVADLPAPDEDEIWLMDLPGLEVRLPGGEVLGRIERVDTPAGPEIGQEIWVIDAGGREVLLPAVPEFVLDIDLDAGVAVVDPPPGLLDIYLGPAPGPDAATDGAPGGEPDAE